MARLYLSLTVLYFSAFLRVASGSEVRVWGFTMQKGLKGMVFSQDIVLQGSVRSKLDCSQLCAVVSSATFTFTKQGPVSGFCRCHSAIMTSSSNNTLTVNSASYASNSDNIPFESSTRDVEVENEIEPCDPDTHTELDDAWRSTTAKQNVGEVLHCDSGLAVGWYRFYLNGSNAVIPTHCVPESQCHTHAPQWLDLNGRSLPGVGQETTARTCAHWNQNCCLYESPITVRNCGSFYVYELHPRFNCQLAHCTEPQI